MSNFKIFSNLVFRQALLIAIAVASAQAIAAESSAKTTDLLPIVACIFDPLGKSGPAYANAKEYMLEARLWGIDADLRAYKDEGVLVDELKSGKCDAIAITTLRARQFNHFVGSLDSVGAVPDSKHMRLALRVLSDPKVANLMNNGGYEIAGIVPLGAAYVMVRDRSINSVERAAGKRVAVLDWDKTQARLVQQMGAQPVASDITNFFTKFNNGQVDIIAAPAIAFKPLELYRGIGDKGGIYRFPLVNVTSVLVIRSEKFPPGIGQKFRELVYQNIDKAFDYIDREERGIDAKYWMNVPSQDKEKYVEMMRQARISLLASGDYNPKMLQILKNIRCKITPNNAECTLHDE